MGKKHNKHQVDDFDFGFDDFNEEDSIFDSSEYSLSQSNYMGGGFDYIALNII